MVKDLIVNLSLGSTSDTTADFAVSIASTLNAHVTGLALCYEPILPPVEMIAIPANVIDMQIEENERVTEAATSRFEEIVRRDGLSGDVRIVRATLPEAPDRFARMARRFDLSIVGQPGPKTPNSDTQFVEAALFSSGRPVLVVPYIQRGGLTLDRAMVCWDGSRAAARAVADAVSLLRLFKQVEVVTVTGSDPDINELPGADIAQHLARHDVNVDLKRIVAGDLDTTNVILSHAADTAADLIVMGGYGHSRWREFVLGGVTRGLLKSMTVPTFMSH
jgi:nucleotide-binding universal stress UspA family protein